MSTLKFDEFLNEKKKLNAGLKAYLDKKAEQKEDKEDKKEECEEECDDKYKDGLTAGQKKLPLALRKAILKKREKDAK